MPFLAFARACPALQAPGGNQVDCLPPASSSDDGDSIYRKFVESLSKRLGFSDLSHNLRCTRKLSGEFQLKRICNSKMQFGESWAYRTSKHEKLENIRKLESGSGTILKAIWSAAGLQIREYDES